MNLLNVISIEMGIDLRRRNVGMTKHFLDGSEVSSPFNKMGSEGMT